MKAPLVSALLLLALASGCGNGSSSSPTAGSTNPHAKAPTPAITAAQVAACKRALGPLVAAENQLDSRLNVGIKNDDYTSRLGDISVAYDAAVVGLKKPGLPNACVNRVGLALQRAFNDYRQAGDIWSKCIQDYSCDFGKGSPALKRTQAKWQKASVALSTARSNLASLGS